MIRFSFSFLSLYFSCIKELGVAGWWGRSHPTDVDRLKFDSFLMWKKRLLVFYLLIIKKKEETRRIDLCKCADVIYYNTAGKKLNDWFLVRLHKITTYFDSFFFYLSLRGFLEKKIDKRIKVMKKIYDEEGRRGKNRLMAAATPSSCVCLYMYST